MVDSCTKLILFSLDTCIALWERRRKICFTVGFVYKEFSRVFYFYARLLWEYFNNLSKISHICTIFDVQNLRCTNHKGVHPINSACGLSLDYTTGRSVRDLENLENLKKRKNFKTGLRREGKFLKSQGILLYKYSFVKCTNSASEMFCYYLSH